ncbi:MAG: VPLPA-CTERM sorting domain-containing protein, partial [Gammaproteobacteria bacterium]|nr:VPLPA-CTERM sorting domain-containing protein [Gammaproteobacteria bacterium]
WYALAVRPGDVAVVPVPAAVWLFGSGLLGLIGVARRKAA